MEAPFKGRLEVGRAAWWWVAAAVLGSPGCRRWWWDVGSSASFSGSPPCLLVGGRPVVGVRHGLGVGEIVVSPPAVARGSGRRSRWFPSSGLGLHVHGNCRRRVASALLFCLHKISGGLIVGSLRCSVRCCSGRSGFGMYFSGFGQVFAFVIQHHCILAG